jgi:carboxyl-terminal processing protease
MRFIKNINIKIALLVVIVFTFGFTLSDSDYFFKVNKSIDIFGRVYKELTLNYVDELDPEVFMEAGIDGMLKSLDPYTNFISSSEASDMDLITTGKYGGVGISIGTRDGMIIITSLMEGYTAQRQGLRIGDQILDVDGKSLANVKLEDIRHLTRGEPGTEVKVKVKREGEAKPLEFVLIREEIKLKNISYAEFVKDGIVLIRLDRFARSAGDELRLAIKELKLKGEIKGIILDVRDNPGGLLEAAVDVVSKFVLKGSLIVSTKGRRPESENKFSSVEEPLLKDIPLAILVNQTTASASEIVAGAMQDLDRGVIVGTRTFGKGLVQNIIPLLYDNQLKMTTAKYYTPSGRCIQEIDYMHKGKDGLFTITPDSLRKEYITKNSRKVQEFGGIHPDTTVADSEPSLLFTELMRKAMFFKFANHYVSIHKELPEDFSVNGELCKQYKDFVDKENFIYEDEGVTKLDEVCRFAEKSKYDSELIDAIKALKSKFNSLKDNAFETNKKELADALQQEIMSRYKGEKGRFEATFVGDMQVQTALGVLQDSGRYKKVLNIHN